MEVVIELCLHDVQFDEWKFNQPHTPFFFIHLTDCYPMHTHQASKKLKF